MKTTFRLLLAAGLVAGGLIAAGMALPESSEPTAIDRERQNRALEALRQRETEPQTERRRGRIETPPPALTDESPVDSAAQTRALEALRDREAQGGAAPLKEEADRPADNVSAPADPEGPAEQNLPPPAEQDLPPLAATLAQPAAEFMPVPDDQTGSASAGAVLLQAPLGTSAKANETVPMIVIEDSPLPDAIRVLARQAGINFQFDPRVVPGQPGPDGRLAPQPQVSFRWENVTAYQALNALLDNHNLRLVHDPNTGIARVTVYDPEMLEPLVTAVIQFRNTHAETNLVGLLRATLSPRSQVLLDPRNNQLLVMTTEREMAGLEELVDRFDLPARQVLIEADILETTRNPATIKGIDWSGTLRGQEFSFGNGLPHPDADRSPHVLQIPGGTSTSTTPGGRRLSNSDSFSEQGQLTTVLGRGGLSANTLSGLSPAVGFLNADGVRGVLSFLNTDADTESIATPRAVTLDGVETELSVVRNIPVFEEEQGAAVGGAVGAATVRPVYDLMIRDTILNEVGVKLKVTPRVVGESNVFLALHPEISSVEPLPERKVLGDRVNEAPIFARRTITTTAMVPSGNTLVLGGLNSDNVAKTYTKVPILGDLPGIGLLFRRDGKERMKQHLIMFITPTIIRSENFQPTATTFLDTPIPPPPEWRESAWDAGKPVDWTQPQMTADRMESSRGR